MQNVMLDLETMGNTPNAAITAIGAVKFDDGEIVGNFYDIVSLKSCTDLGMDIDPDTVIWWMQQSDDARSIFNLTSEARTLSWVLQNFTKWMNDKAKVWGNGSDFDNVILSNAYQRCGMIRPWSHKDNRCYRTMKNMYKDIEFKKIGTAHNALDDAHGQAEHLIKILKYKAYCERKESL